MRQNLCSWLCAHKSRENRTDKSWLYIDLHYVNNSYKYLIQKIVHHITIYQTVISKAFENMVFCLLFTWMYSLFVSKKYRISLIAALLKYLILFLNRYQLWPLPIGLYQNVDAQTLYGRDRWTSTLINSILSSCGYSHKSAHSNLGRNVQ